MIDCGMSQALLHREGNEMIPVANENCLYHFPFAYLHRYKFGRFARAYAKVSMHSSDSCC